MEGKPESAELGDNNPGHAEVSWLIDEDGDVAMASPVTRRGESTSSPSQEDSGRKEAEDQENSEGGQEVKGEKSKNSRPAALPRIPPRTYPGLRCKSL